MTLRSGFMMTNYRHWIRRQTCRPRTVLSQRPAVNPQPAAPPMSVEQLSMGHYPYYNKEIPNLLFSTLLRYPRLSAFCKHMEDFRSLPLTVLKASTVSAEELTLLGRGERLEARNTPLLRARDELSHALYIKLKSKELGTS